ncbi:MAG: 33-cGAMP-specific phosphodieSPTERase 1 [Firmicutes bacterium]|nr:33-cGAMP-specific phosphodieSPTERase 1 [Bacillota bacterium]
MKDSPTLGELACPILHHHDHWDDSDPSGLVKDDIPLISRIINLADTCEILLSNKTFILDQRSQILDVLISKSGTVFDPTLVKALLEVGKQESFWLDLTNPYYYETFFQNLNQFGKVRVSVDDILEFAQIFATIIDRTSTFTANHSRSVAEVSAVLAQAKKYSATEIKMMRIAGLLHDLGKLAVPNAILEKPGKLSAYEYSVIKQHPYYTYHILSQIEGFEIIAEWAAYHHETLDGQGYPFRVEPDQIRLGSRIVAVADIFVALSEHRPYRPPLNRQQVQKIMYDMADHHKLDKELVDDLWQCTELLNSPKLHQLLSFN